MKYAYFILSCIIGFQEIPYKADDQFTIKFDLSFRQRPTTPQGSVNLTETRAEYERRTNTDQLPYLVLTVLLDEVAENETRVKVVRDNQVFVLNKKVTKGMDFKLNMGFTDDLKDHVQGYLHEITFYNAKKSEVSKIVIEFDRDGNYIVNGVKRGKV